MKPEKVFTGEELERFLTEAKSVEHYPLVLFLADTGARLGEAATLRWSDVDLESGSALIARSFSSGRDLGPTKSGRERTAELSTRLRALLTRRQPDLYPPEALAFASRSGGFVDESNLRRSFTRIVRRALGRDALT